MRCTTVPAARSTPKTDIASGWFGLPNPGTRIPPTATPSSASFDGTPYAGNDRPRSARVTRVTPGTSGYSNMPTLETHASCSSGDNVTANGLRPTRTDWTTLLDSTSTVTSR